MKKKIAFFKKRKQTEDVDECKRPHGHCKICGKPVLYEYEDEYYTVKGEWESFIVCENCYYKVKNTCLLNSKSKSRAKTEKGYF